LDLANCVTHSLVRPALYVVKMLRNGDAHGST
jgi:hypothetical protein